MFSIIHRGPRFELMASGTMDLSNVSENVGTFDLQIEPTPEGAGCELPLFGVFCCRLAAQPECLTNPTTTGYLNLLVSNLQYLVPLYIG